MNYKKNMKLKTCKNQIENKMNEKYQTKKKINMKNIKELYYQII